MSGARPVEPHDVALQPPEARGLLCFPHMTSSSPISLAWWLAFGLLGAACSGSAQPGTGGGSEGGAGGSAASDAQCLQDPPPEVGSPCGEDVQCDFPWAVDACGNSDLDLQLSCEDGSWVLVNVNLIGCDLSCPEAAPVDGSACDPATDGTHCPYVGEDETLLAACVGDGAGGGGAGGGPPAESGHWQVTRTPILEPEDPPSGCELEQMTVTPTQGSPTGACEAGYTCGEELWAVSCDAEDDGTGQSLCTCYLDDEYVDSPLVAGSGEVACAAAAVSCVAR